MPVIGIGEVGSAILELAGENSGATHICFPWQDRFIEQVRSYPGLIIIHSTVPVGTTEQIPGAVHAPIRGRHPHLIDSIRGFTMYVGGQRAAEAVVILHKMGVGHIVTTPNPRNTEALKLWDTTYYGWNIIFQRAVKKYCDEHGLDYDLIYEHANRTYNSFYGKPYHRPILEDMPGRIGGHCVIPNCELLDDDIARYIVKFNEGLKDG